MSLESAFDEKHPYYDAKSTREKPKWCVVGVEFRQKFEKMVTLKELQKYRMLNDMQAMKQARLSVSKVSKKEWEFILRLADVDPMSYDEDEKSLD